MKKALIAIIATIYIVAIVIVSFLGTRAEVINTVTYVEEIILTNESLPYPGIDNPLSKEDRITTVYLRPEESEIDEEGKGYGKNEKDTNPRKVNWNYGHYRRDYIIYIEDYSYLYNNRNGKYTLKTTVLPLDATNKKLTFSVEGSDAAKGGLEWTDYGEFTFKHVPKTLDDWMDVDIIIKATDFSEVAIDVLIKWAVQLTKLKQKEFAI